MLAPLKALAGAMAICLSLTLAARAEEPSMIEEIDRDQIRQVSELVVQNIEIGDCGNAKCGPATAIEKIDGMLPNSMTKEVIARGAGSAFAEFCDMDWGTRSYLPLLEREQNSGCWSERQLAAVAVTHGVAMSMYRGSLAAEIGQCTKSVNEAVEKYLSSLRNHTRRTDCPRW